MDLTSERLTTEIMLRLPVKSVVRFKTVSKQWLSIASNPRFRQIHASRSRINYTTGLFCIRASTVITNIFQFREYVFLPLIQITPSILPINHNRSIHLISWSGGLQLFRSLPSGIGNVGDYFVCNPTTNEVKQIPVGLVSQLIADSFYVSSYLAFDPRKSPHYKIVFLCLSLLNDFPKIMIYSSGTERFSSPKLMKMKCGNNSMHGGYYCNNAIHWISDENCLYYFDLNTEELKEFRPLPVLFWCCKYFGECLGHLILVAINGDNDCLVYELKNDYSGWFVKYQVSIEDMSNAFPNYEIKKTIGRYQFKVLGIKTDKEDEENLMLVLQVFDSRGDYVAYSFKNKQGLILGGFPLDATYKNGDKLYSWSYIETLACV